MLRLLEFLAAKRRRNSRVPTRAARQRHEKSGESDSCTHAYRAPLGLIDINHDLKTLQ
jgi:hypothetical protein